MQYDILVVGDLNVDLNLIGEDVAPAFDQQEKLVEDAVLDIGGSSGIFASQAAKLGLRVAFAGEVGDDAFGRFLIRALGELSIETKHIQVNPALKTGITVHLVQGGDRAMLTYMGTLGVFQAAHVTPEVLAEARHIHSGSYFMMPRLRPRLPALFSQARQLGASTSLDTNFDPSGEWNGGLKALLAEVDVFFPNERELVEIGGAAETGAAVDALLAHGVGSVAVKLGSEGAAAYTGAESATCAPFAVEVVDTCGAGDSFNAGFLYGYLSDWPLSDALRLGCACGALCTTGPGGTSAQPGLAQARAMADIT